MAGLIWAGIGQGIANAGATAANIGVRDYEMREAARLRREDKEEDRAWREEQKDIDRDRQDERDKLYRKTVEQQIAAGKGSGGMKGVDPADIAPGGRLAHLIAGEAGMTVPDYEKQINAMKTGDMSGYETIVGARAGEEGPTPIKALPEGFKKEFDAKAKMLSQLAMTYVTGSEAKGIAEAKQIGLVTNAMEGAQAGGDVTKAAQLAAISKGHVPYAGDSNVTRNVLTGDTSTTAVGAATISEKGALAKQAEAGATENAAQAKAADALAAERTATLPKLTEEIKKLKAETEKIQKETNQVGVDKTHERLSSIINSANATVTALQNTSKGNTPESKAAWDKQLAEAEALRRKAIALQTGALDSRTTPPPAATGKRTSGGAPKKVTKDEYDALPSGAQYIDPNGQIRTKQ